MRFRAAVRQHREGRLRDFATAAPAPSRESRSRRRRPDPSPEPAGSAIPRHIQIRLASRFHAGPPARRTRDSKALQRLRQKVENPTRPPREQRNKKWKKAEDPEDR